MNPMNEWDNEFNGKIITKTSHVNTSEIGCLSFDTKHAALGSQNLIGEGPAGVGA